MQHVGPSILKSQNPAISNTKRPVQLNEQARINSVNCLNALVSFVAAVVAVVVFQSVLLFLAAIAVAAAVAEQVADQ